MGVWYHCRDGHRWVMLDKVPPRVCPACDSAVIEIAPWPQPGQVGGTVYESRQYLNEAMRALRRCEDWARLVTGNEPLATRVRQLHEQLTEDVMNGNLGRPSVPEDLEAALDAVFEVMGMDKGPSEEEWVEWANRTLPLMQRHGRLTDVVDYS